ncbi:uncharacterized protein DS421_1g18540 [Arachis hypogaea]|nr:uncharacterized protein DS421_1g18540 [Arachis hypogaea]
MEDEARLYRLNGIAHVAGSIDDEPTRVISGVRRQQNMPLHERIIPYLETAGLYHLARLNSHWFWVDEPLLSAFIEQWRPEMHTFHMPFGECTITLQDVAYQLGLPIDGEPVNASEETVCIYARAYIVMLLSSQLFVDKNANRVHLRWLPYLASLDELGRYSWGSAALVWLYRCLCRGTNRNVVNLTGPLQLLQSWIFWRFPSLRPGGFHGFRFPLASRWASYLPRNDAVGQRVLSARLMLDRLRVQDFVWEPYSSAEVASVIHPEILVDQHRRLWTAITSLIYFAAIEWHQVDRVIPQFGGVQHLPLPALNIDWLHGKDGRGGDQWFPRYYREWHEHWENRLYSVIPVQRVVDPGSEADCFDRGGSSQRVVPGPPRVHVYDKLDNRRVNRRHRIGTRTTDREWRWLVDRLDEDQPIPGVGDAVDHRVPRRRARRQPGPDGGARSRGRGPTVEDEGTQHGVADDVSGSATGMDQPTYDVGSSSQMFGSFEPQAFADFTTAAVGMDIDDPVSQSEFFRDIADMLRTDDATHYRPEMPEPWIPLGGTPASAFSAVPRETAAAEADQRPRRVRRPPLCGTGGHLLGQFDDDVSDTIEDSD